MSGQTSKKLNQAIVAALCDHPDAEKYRRRLSVPGDAQETTTADLLSRAPLLTKADFFVEDDHGRTILDTPGTWRNFDKIVSLLTDKGEHFTVDDFSKPLRGGMQRSLLDSARVNNALGKIFSFDVWKGRYDEMETLWYKVPFPDRKAVFANQGLISYALKKRLFDAEGRVTPEERLAKSGQTPDSLRKAFNDQSVDSIGDLNDILKKNGDYLRKEYVLMPDAAGNTLFDSSGAWKKFDSLMAIMSANGERFEVSELTRQFSFAKSILARAAEYQSLSKIFKSEYWAGRPSDMASLWSHVADAWKLGMSVREFDEAYIEVESRTYAKAFESLTFKGKADLLSPINAASGTEKAVLPLGLKVVWDNFGNIQAALAAAGGEQLKLADLRAKSGALGNSCLVSAAKYGRFDKVVALVRKTGETLTYQDFLSKDSHGAMLINILADRGQLALAFDPNLWVGKTEEMRALWKQVRTEHRSQVDFQRVEAWVRQAALKKKAPPVKLKPRGPKKP